MIATIRRIPNPKPTRFRPYVYEVTRGGEEIAICTTYDSAKTISLLTKCKVTDTIPKQQGVKL